MIHILRLEIWSAWNYGGLSSNQLQNVMHYFVSGVYIFNYWRWCHWVNEIVKHNEIRLSIKIGYENWWHKGKRFKMPVGHHYNLWLLYTHFLKTKKFILRVFFCKILVLCTDSIQDLFIIKIGLWWRTYGTPLWLYIFIIN